MSSHAGFRDLIWLSLGLEALLFFGSGLYAAIRRRPFVIRASWILLVVLMTLLPMGIMQVSMWLEMRRNPYGHSIGFWPLLGPAMLLVFGAFLAFASRGYLVFSATQSSFREALVGALESLALPFEETLAAVRLPTVPAELHVAVQGWIGTGQFRLRQGGSGRIVADIARAMNRRFGAERMPTNITWAILNIVVGLLMGAMLFGLATF